jgi:ABC-type multidrug transport system fused ATPase/permease subunit
MTRVASCPKARGVVFMYYKLDMLYNIQMSQSKIFWKAFIKIFILFTLLVFITDQSVFTDLKLLLLMILANSIVAVLIALPFSFFKKNKNISPATWDTLDGDTQKTRNRFLFHFILNTLVSGSIVLFLLQMSHSTLTLSIVTLFIVLIVGFADAWFRFYKS